MKRSIVKTVDAVIKQTVLPEKWIIVSDGTTDQTDEIVARYASKYHFIQLVHNTKHCKRDWGFEVKAFNIGYA